MKLLIIFVYLIISNFSYASEKPNIKNLVLIKNPKIYEDVIFKDINQKDVKLDDFKGKLVILNFWATWCAPCVKELPYFEKINKVYKAKGVELLLVSLDFPRKYETKLKPFLKEKQLKSEVVCLNDVDQNRWIPAIDTTWSGAIPATMIYKGNKRKFYEKSFTYEELEKEVQQFLK